MTYTAERFYILLKKKTDINGPQTVFSTAFYKKNIKFGTSNSRSSFQICYLRRNELFTQNNDSGGPWNRGFEKMLHTKESTDKAEECVVIKSKTKLTDFTEHGTAITYLQRENKTHSYKPVPVGIRCSLSQFFGMRVAVSALM